MTAKANEIDIPALIDANKLSGFQIWILILVGLTVLIDGFDVQAMGYVAPAIIQDWGVSKGSLGPVFGAGLFGMLVGSLSLSVLADKIGRRPVLIGSSLFFSICMLATAWTTSIAQLEVIRFITGLGLGAIMPNAMALAGEYSPKRNRVTLMMLVSCGFTGRAGRIGPDSGVRLAIGVLCRQCDSAGDGDADVFARTRVAAVPRSQEA